MIAGSPRIAFFPCAYNEVDGMANTARHFEACARRREVPLLNIHGGSAQYCEASGWLQRVEFQRRWPKFSLDKNHDFDLLFWRYYERVKRIVLDFQPDLIHITGPSDVGQLGSLLAHRLRIPLVASWHTNLHEYAERRAVAALRFLPRKSAAQCGNCIREASLKLLARYYRIPRVLFAPNRELAALLTRLTGKPTYLMGRGVDVDLFSPERRTRRGGPFTLGYVGRITAEKNVALLITLERALLEAGYRDFRFLVVGQGAAEAWLRANLRQADFTGVLEGAALGRAYANMDAFVFPSRTDTFGNVVLEALASGVPAVVTDGGGPKFIIKDGETGLVARSEDEFVRQVAVLLDNGARQQAMARAARAYALGQSWDAVFDQVLRVYRRMLSGVQPTDVMRTSREFCADGT